MDRPSTIMLCKVVPGIGFKVIRVFSASATNSGSLRVFRKYQCPNFNFSWFANVFNMGTAAGSPGKVSNSDTAT
jgi:hypothetical protein